MDRRARVAWSLAALAGVLAGPAQAVGGTVFDNGGNVFVTWDSTHWSDGFPGLDFSLPTMPEGARRDLVRYSGWWVRPGTAAAETRLGNPSQESYDAPNSQADLLWSCAAGTTCVLSERGRVSDARGDLGAGTFVSEILVRNSSSVVGVLEVFHYLDPLTHGQVVGDESATFVRPNFIDFEALGVGRRLRYRASGLPVSSCSADNYSSASNLMVQLNDGSATQLVQPTATGFSSSLGMNCAMQWHLALQPGEMRVLRVSVSTGIDLPLIKGDFDLDNYPDVYFEDAATQSLKAWPMKGSSRWQGGATGLPALGGFRVVGVGDFNNDYVSDLVLRRSASPYELRIRFGDGVGYGPPTVMSVPIRSAEWELAATADFSRDGQGDLLWRNTVTQALEISIMSGISMIGLATPHPDHAVDANWKVVAAADFDRDADRDVDLLWYNVSSGKIVYWLLDPSYQRVTGFFADPPNAGDANWQVVASSDFGRGPLATLPTAFAIPDILWRNATSTRLVVWHMNAAGQRTSGLFTTPAMEDDPGWLVVGPR